jgi:hypothetical protein
LFCHIFLSQTGLRFAGSSVVVEYDAEAQAIERRFRMEPVTTSGITARIITALKDFPLWLLLGLAISATICVLAFNCIPEFNRSVPTNLAPWFTLGAILFWSLAGCRFADRLIAAYRGKIAARHTFHLTPIDNQGRWEAAKQPDGSVVTIVSADLIAKNRTEHPICLASARLIKPNIAGEAIQALVFPRLLNAHDTEHVSGWNNPACGVPACGVSQMSLTISIRGAPQQKTGTLAAVLAVSDEEGNEQRVKLQLKSMDPK